VLFKVVAEGEAVSFHTCMEVALRTARPRHERSPRLYGQAWSVPAPERKPVVFSVPPRLPYASGRGETHRTCMLWQKAAMPLIVREVRL